MTKTKSIFITGGASGLGRALAHHFAQNNFKVCIGDINEVRGNEVVKELVNKNVAAVKYLHCDVTSEDDLKNAKTWMLDNWNGVDVVINNAGVASSAKIEDESIENWEWIININILGVVRGCKVFTPVFKQQQSGYFINIASMAGLVYLPTMSSYNATKSAVVALSETLKMELIDHGIGISVVCPAFFRTNLHESMRSDESMKDVIRKLFDNSPINAEKVAEIIFNGYRQNEFMILTHPKAKMAYQYKKRASVEDWFTNFYEETKKFRE